MKKTPKIIVWSTALGALLYAVYAYAATVNLGRSVITWPDFGDPAGPAQVQTIHDGIQALSDNANSRFEAFSAVADFTTSTHTHNFGVAFSELTVLIYTGTHPTLTRVADPTAAGWTIAAGASPLTQVDITTPASGGPHTFAVVVIQGSAVEVIDDLDDVDVTTSAPEDGQALVFDAGSSEWIPGASGDSSFKCQSVSDPDVTIKSGFLILDSGVELQIASDLTVSLDTILGSDPANATAYYLYLDLDQVPDESLLASGRQVRIVSAANHFALQTATPDDVSLSRYLPICLIRSADSGTVWSGTGSSFETLAIRRHGRPIVNVSPTVYELSKQSVGSVGAIENAQQALVASVFPGAATETSFFHLEDVNDDSTNGRNLTNNGSIPFTAKGFFGRSIPLMDRDLSQSFTSSNTHFNPGDADFSLGGWFKVDEITNTMNLMSQGASGDRSWTLILVSGGVIRWSPTNSAGSYDTDFEPSGDTDVAPNEWFHVVVTHTASTNNHRVYLNGQFTGEVTQQLRVATTPIFDLGAQFGNVQNFLSGSIQDAFLQNGTVLSDSEINAIYSRRFKGKQLAGGHILDSASMPQNLPSSNISFYNLGADGNDDSGNARNLTNNGTTPFSGLNIFGQAGAAQADGSTQYFSSSDAFFNPDDEAFATGGWFAMDDPTSPNFLITQNFSNSDRGWRILYDGIGNLSFSVTNDATPAAFAVISEFKLTDLPIRNGSWHHLAMSYDGEGNLRYFLDGQAIGSNVISDVRAPTGGNNFNVMATDGGGSFARGRVQDVFFIRDIVSDSDIARLASSRLDHSAAISVLENQQWYGQFFKQDNGDIQNELDQGFVLDKKENTLYLDLGLDEGDQVALRLQNQGLSTTVVPIKTFTTGKVTSSPGFPLSHGLGCRPKDFYVLTEGQTLSGDDDKRFDLCSADDSTVTCDLSSLTIDASHPVEVVASCAPIAVAIDIATDAA